LVKTYRQWRQRADCVEINIDIIACHRLKVVTIIVDL
jgi:hypothetical protein